MFAVLNNHIRLNAGRELALQRAGIFYVRNYFSTTLYRCSNTPVYRLNGRTAFSRECVKQRVRFGHLFYLYLCYSITTFPILHCLAETERPPTKRASDPHPLLPEILTPTSHAWAWTCRAATSATAARPTRRGTPLPARSTSAARATPWEPRLILSSSNGSSPNGRRSKPTTAVAAPQNACGLRWRSSAAIPTRPYCPPTSRKGTHYTYYYFPLRRFSTESRPGRVHPELDNDLPTLLKHYNHGNKDNQNTAAGLRLHHLARRAV